MKAVWIVTCLAACALSGSAGAAAAARRAIEPDFSTYWHDGRAELDGYRLNVFRYGRPRVGRGVLVYVTEPFSESRHVKVDDPKKNPSDTFDALKLNLVRRFQTGIYDYNTMVSLFTKSADFMPVKITFTSAEWCGQVYEHLDFAGGRLSGRFDSYFEGESAERSLDVPRDAIAEDDLFILLRGLRGPYLKAGEKRTVPFLTSPFYRRLAHQGLMWSSATLERLASAETVRVPAGTFATDVYVVRTGDHRQGRFHVEHAYPHRIVRWSWKADAANGQASPLGGTDSGELTGTERLQYWKLHDPGDEKHLAHLGLEPVMK